MGMEPLRLISLADWGYESEVTGSVADLQWSPDSRALAVSMAALVTWQIQCRDRLVALVTLTGCLCRARCI